MKEQLIICNHCGSDACSEITNEEDKGEPDYKVWICMTCGFTSSPGCIDANRAIIEEVLPELYKDLRFKDENNLYWYPTSINLPQNGMVFAEGTSTEDWSWSAVPVRKLKLKEKLKFPRGITHVPDMKKKKSFGQNEFMDGLDFIGYFDMIKKQYENLPSEE
jgi:hypothetical protein